MTIETPKASRPVHQGNMFANPQPVFYDYATSPVASDHSLHTDLRFSSSPNSLTMYDGDAEILPNSLGSMCSNNSFVDTGQQPQEDFDLKPQFECTDNTFLNQYLQLGNEAAGTADDAIGGVRNHQDWSSTEAGLMKMEDIFQVDQKDAIQGPTLAELNFDDSLSVYDDVVEKDSEQQKRLVSGGCTLWQQAILSGMDNTFNVPQVVCGGQKPPIKFTTCTVTSPTATAVDMRMSTMENKVTAATSSSHSVLPQSLNAITAKLSLFPEGGPTPVKVLLGSDSIMVNNTSGGCLKVPQQQQPPQGSNLTLLGNLVPQPQPAPPPLQPAPHLTKLSPGNPPIMPALNMENDETKSSLQRLLTDQLPPVLIKSEPVDIPIAAPASTPMWHSAPAAAAAVASAGLPLSPPTSTISSSLGILAQSLPLKSIKRARSPEIDLMVTSMEQKWEEIKQFIHDEEEEEDLKDEPIMEITSPSVQPPQIRHHRQQATQEQQMAFTPPKKIKVEPKDPAFTVKDEVESGDEDGDPIDSDAEDSDGGESALGRDQDDHSDAESDSHFSLLDENTSSSKGPPRYFWMYNTQSKGPKGKRLCKAVSTADPYTLGDFEDPVFDPELNQTQYKHNGKARRGDGNDITPSPQKLYALGSELKKLNSTINDLTPVSELPSGARSKSRKEKNKLASRACRLKKKAQHEANKVKLYGLEKEHHDLLMVLSEIRDKVFKIVRSGKSVDKESEQLSPKLERLMKMHLTHMIAGHTADYVNSVLAKVMNGDPMGGLALQSR